MKHLFTFLATLLFTVTFAQQQLIAIKGTTTDAIATTLEEAINIAQPNDKIYLPGGNYTLNDSIQKPLHIIGTGYNHLIPRATPITTITSVLKIGSQASGAILEGVKLTNNIYCASNNISFKNIYQSIDNMIRFYIKSGKENILFSNCIIRWIHPYSGENLVNFNINNSIINTIFYLNNSTIKNSIVGIISNSNNLDIYNSLIANLQLSNLVNLYNSVFTLYSSYFSNANLSDFTIINNNFTLTSSCPIQNIGVYFGQYPWKDGGQPINPHIEENNSFLDVQNEQFKLKVKVVPQTN